MPYQNEHAARLMDPKLFDNFRRVNNRLGEGIHAIFGRLKSDGGWRLQAIRFDARMTNCRIRMTNCRITHKPVFSSAHNLWCV